MNFKEYSLNLKNKALSIFIGHNMLTILIHTNNLIQNYQTKYIDIILRAYSSLKFVWYLIYLISVVNTVNVVIYWMSLYQEH